ncbi:hypothetical protein KJ636_01515, partial [Patescibacteria group bacterium]|nr:hypothetical protein [Patescibacteria group bacterium]
LWASQDTTSPPRVIRLPQSRIKIKYQTPPFLYPPNKILLCIIFNKDKNIQSLESLERAGSKNV